MKNLSSSLETSHVPVLLNEILNISEPTKGGIFLDCTFGGGGYSRALLAFPKTTVIGIDRDSAVVSIAKNLKKKFQDRFHFHQLKFSQINKIINHKVDAIIFDLGLSSIQLKDFTRGFSFKSKEELDMTMGFSKISAKDVVNDLSESQLKLIIKILGEEKDASNIAKNIVLARKEKKITRVDELVKIIEMSKKKNFSGKINPSTKTFQAIRIFVNKEMSELIYGIINATKILRPGGKMLIVSFHSIEDKIVKYFFTNFSENKSKPSRYIPENLKDDFTFFKKYTNKIIQPSKDELLKNNASRSAKLRIAIRNENNFVHPEKFINKFYKYLNIEAVNE